MKLYEYLKNILLVMIIVHVAPAFISSVYKQYSAYAKPKTKVGVIEINTPICNSDTYVTQLQTYFKDRSIKAILLKIECPGGAAGSAQAIFNEIIYLKKTYSKPIITLTENVCASGGYYIACATDHIIAPGSALIGSIGTSVPYLFKIKDFIEFFKIRNEALKAGAYKNMTNPFTELTQDERTLLQSVLDDAYAQFSRDVALCRQLDLAGITIWGNGKIFTAEQAQKLKLVDTIGSLHDAIAILKEKAFVEGDIEWVRKKDPSFIAHLFGETDDGDEPLSARLMQLCSNYIMSHIHVQY